MWRTTELLVLEIGRDTERMEVCKRIIFVGQSGSSREPMAAGILKEFTLKHPVEVLARGLVVLFPEEDITEETLILTMESVHRDRILEQYANANPEHVFVLTEFVGDELEILNPYGGALPNYGLCYESMRASIKKLVRILNENE